MPGKGTQVRCKQEEDLRPGGSKGDNAKTRGKIRSRHDKHGKERKETTLGILVRTKQHEHMQQARKHASMSEHESKKRAT